MDVELLVVRVVFLTFGDLFSQLCDQFDELRPFDLLRIEVVGFGYVNVGDNVLRGLSHEHVLVDRDLMEILLVLLLLEIVLDQ